jgi:hypothetical protein
MAPFFVMAKLLPEKLIPSLATIPHNSPKIKDLFQEFFAKSSKEKTPKSLTFNKAN